MKRLYGSSVEQEPEGRFARLKSISCEAYIKWCNAMGNPYPDTSRTVFAFEVIRDETDTYMRVDENMPQYEYLPDVHKSRLVDEPQEIPIE